MTTVQAMADGTTYTVEIYFDGTTAFCFVDGTEMASVLATAPSFPDNEEMRLTLEFLTGEAIANTLTVYEMRMIHLRG